MNQRQLKEYARKQGISFESIQRQKNVIINIPALPSGSQSRLYFPFDTELKASIITNIRCLYNSVGLPATLPTGQTVAPQGAFPQFVFSFLNDKGVYLHENISMWMLIQTANINKQMGWNCFMRFNPEKSFLTYFDVANTRSGFSFVIQFTYNRIIA